MKKRLGILLFALVFVFFNSCNYKERKLREEFVGKVWIIDDAKSKSMEELGAPYDHLHYILKPEKDSTISLYKDQYIRFNNFKIKGDTLFLKPTLGSGFHYIPYKFTKTGKYSAILFAYDTININNQNYYELFLTDLTDLFNGKPDNSESKIYQQIKEFVWYPTWIRFYLLSYEKIILDEERPKYYIKENAFYIDDNGKTNFLNKIYGYTDCVYKFVDGSDRYDYQRFYCYDTLKQEFKGKYVVFDMSNNKMEIISKFQCNEHIRMKKIDPSILVDEKDLPKGVRFGCNAEIAREMFEQHIKTLDDSMFYYDLKSIQLIRYNSDDCEYVFTILRRSREFRDIYVPLKILCYASEDGKFFMEQIK